MSNESKGSLVDVVVNEEGAVIALHLIFVDDDRVECQDLDGKTLIIYTCDNKVMSPSGECLGVIHWPLGMLEFESFVDPIMDIQYKIVHPESHLHFEIQISKQILANQVQAQ